RSPQIDAERPRAALSREHVDRPQSRVDGRPSPVRRRGVRSDDVSRQPPGTRPRAPPSASECVVASARPSPRRDVFGPHRQGTGLTPARALALRATLQSADIILPTTDGREIRLRRLTQPTAEQQRLLDQLEITIPTHLEWNAECSGDFAASW